MTALVEPFSVMIRAGRVVEQKACPLSSAWCRRSGPALVQARVRTRISVPSDPVRTVRLSRSSKASHWVPRHGPWTGVASAQLGTRVDSKAARARVLACDALDGVRACGRDLDTRAPVFAMSDRGSLVRERDRMSRLEGQTALPGPGWHP